MRHGTQRKMHTWSSESDKKLLEAVELYGQNNWQLGTSHNIYLCDISPHDKCKLVAMSVSEDANGHQCQKRFFDTVNPALKGGPWTEEEDEKLRRAIAAFSGVSVPISGEERNAASGAGKPPIPWQDVALFVPGRNNNQCRERFQLLGKDRNKTIRQGSKGKGKATTTDDLAGEKDVSDAEISAAKAVSKRTAKPKPRPAFKGKRKGKAKVDVNSGDASSDENATNANANAGDDLAEPEQDDNEENSKSIPRGRPRPRPRKKAGITSEKESNEAEANDKDEATEASIDTKTTRHTPKSKTTQKRNGGGAIRTSKAPTKRKPRQPATEEKAERAGNDYNEDKSDGLEQPTTSEPASKRRKTIGRPKRGAVKTSQPADENPEHGETTQNTTIPEDEPQGRRRSTRLAKGGR